MNLLGVGGLGGQGPIDPLLVGEGDHGGDPGVVRGAHLSQCFQRDRQGFLSIKGFCQFPISSKGQNLWKKQPPSDYD